jgi:predicted metalloprotease with PDZ domain
LRFPPQSKTVEFNVILDQPLGMKIDIGPDSSEEDSFPAMVTEVVEGGQAADAGIEVEMHVVAMNGESTKGKTLDDVVQMVIEAKTEQKPLVMSLKML